MSVFQQQNNQNTPTPDWCGGRIILLAA